MINKIIFLSSVLLLTACASGHSGMKLESKGPRGIFISNIMKKDHVKAYRAAEKHCSKYSKVPRIVKTINYDTTEDSPTAMRTESYECIRPSN